MSYLVPLCLSFLICLMGRCNSIDHVGSFCGFNEVNPWEVPATLPRSNKCSINKYSLLFSLQAPIPLSKIMKIFCKSCENQEFPHSLAPKLIWEQTLTCSEVIYNLVKTSSCESAVMGFKSMCLIMGCSKMYGI